MEKIKVKYYSKELKEIREHIRSLGSAHAPYYDYWGDYKGSKLLPIYYSDTLKFCYPNQYFSKTQMEIIVEKVKKFIKKKNYDVEIDYEDNYWIGGLHCNGYKLKIKLN